MFPGLLSYLGFVEFDTKISEDVPLPEQHLLLAPANWDGPGCRKFPPETHCYVLLHNSYKYPLPAMKTEPLRGFLRQLREGDPAI